MMWVWEAIPTSNYSHFSGKIWMVDYRSWIERGNGSKATPVEGTMVVNIGDFMMRLCNDIYKSTVHRVYNRSTVERVSMPFFFGELQIHMPFRKTNMFQASISTAWKVSSLLAHPTQIRQNMSQSLVVIVSKDENNRCNEERYPNNRAGCQLRFKQEANDSKRKIALQAQAPSAAIVVAWQ
jgi:hypothetical protein